MVRVRTVSGEEERRILTAMIVDRTVLARVASRWGHQLFASKHSNLIGEWCVTFFREYDEAPRAAIESIYQSWADESNRDEATVKGIESLLRTLSGEYEQLADGLNSQYIVDLAGKYFTRIRVRREAEAALADLDMGDLEKAEKRFTDFDRVDLGAGAGVNVFHDKEASRAAYANKSECLIQYSGALGEFLNRQMVRDSFIGVMAPDKTGKSFWLQDFAYRGAMQRRRVAYIVVGDLSMDQVFRRLHVRASGHPAEAEVVRRPTKFTWSDELNQRVTEFRETAYDEEMSWNRGYKALQRKVRDKIKSLEMYMQLFVYASMDVDMYGIMAELRANEQRGWVPDVVVLDYADNLAGVRGVKDVRDQINMSWALMRALSQKQHSLVITASQTDAAAYDAALIRRKNFSNDKRKLAHVSGMIGISVKETEKQYGICRLNWPVLRDGAFTESQHVTVAGSLAVGNPAMLSTW